MALRAPIERWRFSARSSLLLSIVSVAKVLALVSFGNTPATFVRLFTSLKSRSSMFVERIHA